MSAIAHWIARQLWWGMLWFMRRPWMKRLQRASTRIFGPAREARARESLKRQNAFALRYGLRILTVAVMVLLASALITGSYLLLGYLNENGVLRVPGTEPVIGR